MFSEAPLPFWHTRTQHFVDLYLHSDNNGMTSSKRDMFKHKCNENLEEIGHIQVFMQVKITLKVRLHCIAWNLAEASGKQWSKPMTLI